MASLLFISPPKSKRRQPRSATKASQPAAKTTTATSTTTAPRNPSSLKRKRPATAAAPDSSTRPKRARKQAPALPVLSDEDDDNNENTPPDAEISDLDDPEFSSTPVTTKRSRKRQNVSAPVLRRAESSSPPAPEPGTKAIRDAIPIDHPHLAPRVRRIPRAVIAAKWSPLDASSLATIKSTLNLTAQPALIRTGTNAARHAAGLAVVKAVTKRVMGKLTRGLPFPPASAGGVPRGKTVDGTQRARGADGGRADELDYERTVGGVRALEETLDTLLHSVAILERERAGLAQDVEKEHGRVVKLEGDVRREAAMWKENLRKTHPLTPAEPDSGSAATAAQAQRRRELATQDDGRGTAFCGLGGDGADGNDDEQEAEVRDLARQVASHMDSIKTNMAQIDGVVSGIETTRAALQAVLARNLHTQTAVEGESLAANYGL